MPLALPLSVALLGLELVLPMHEPGGNEEEDEEDASPCGRLV